jgi:ribonuclease P protein component
MLRCYYMAVRGSDGAVTVGFTTTRNVLSAARRNRIKRLLRESWKTAGTELQCLARETNQRIQVVFVYRVAAPNKHPHQRMIQESMGRTIKTVISKLETSSQ